MKSQTFVVDYPSEEEVQQRVQVIVDCGMPKKKTFIGFLQELHHQLGWKMIFRDYRDLFLIGSLFVLYISAFMFYLYQNLEVNLNHLYAYLFISSPLFYGAISLVSLLGKKETYDIEMVCKYTPYQVAAYRMLIFSFFSIGLNIAQILMVTVFLQEFDVMKAIMISLTSLFMFSLGFLYLTTRYLTKWKQTLIIGGWVVLNGGVAILNTSLYEQLLLKMPYGVYGFVLIVTGYLYVNQLGKLAIKRRWMEC